MREVYELEGAKGETVYTDNRARTSMHAVRNTIRME